MIAKGQIDRRKDVKGNGIKYEYAFLMQCFILRMKSRKAYIHTRSNMLLPLPSLSTMRRLLSSTECKFRFDKLPLEHNSDAVKGLAIGQRLGCLMWDEIAITKDIRFGTRTLHWKGIVDYGGQTSVIVPDGVTNHALAFVFRTLLGGWIQPFAWFGNKGAASATISIELVVK